MRPRLALVMFLASLLPLAAVVPAQAAFPGANGKIAFAHGSSTNPAEDGLYAINPDGTGLSQITNGQGDGGPRWRPDGQKIAFLRNYSAFLMNPDGTGVQPLSTTNPDAFVRSWSPDGQKIAYDLGSASCYGDPDRAIVIANADGSGETFLTSSSDGLEDSWPAWSPDGTKIAFNRQTYTCDSDGNLYYSPSDVWTMNPDGTQQTNLTSDLSTVAAAASWSPDGTKMAYSCGGICTMNADGSNKRTVTAAGFTPAWSPDGTKIAFNQQNANLRYELWLVSPDGTGLQQLTHPTPSQTDLDGDWQPLAMATYEHPASASTLNVSLVPAFKPCGTGGNPSNAKHAAPLATNSCNPPKPSVLAAVGGSSQSSAQMSVTPGDTDPTNGNQANVSISASLTDIQAVAGGDYNPNPSGADLTAVTRFRFTDKANGYGGLPATASEYDFRVPIDCSSTPDPSVGSTCSANTTANALVPGLIQEQRQTVVQTFRVRIDDSGANGIRGDSDDRIFATQGVFIP